MTDGDIYESTRDKITNWLETDEGKESKWAEYVMLVPDLLHLLVKLMADPDVPVKEKAKVGAVLAYFMSPIDILPEAVSRRIGFLDNLALSAFVLEGIVNHVSPEVVQRNWTGDPDLLQLIQRVLDNADAMLGMATWTRLRKLVA